MGDIYTNPPQSRNEAILRATIDGTEYTDPPESRIEDLLLELKETIEEGGSVEANPEGVASETLSKLKVDDTIYSIPSGGGGGGTSDYTELDNKPEINGVTLAGNKTAADLGLVGAETGKGLSSNDYTNADKAIVDGVTAALADKVDKVAGKGLSTNDYTDADAAIVAGVTTALNGKVDKVSGATSGNFAGLNSNGNLTDSGKKASDFLPSNTPIPDEVTANPQGTATEILTKLGIGSDIYEIPSGGSSKLVDLTDVNISSPSDGQILQYDAASQKWVNHINTPEFIVKTITIYSAANDTVSFSDISGEKTVVTDSSGEGSVKIFCVDGLEITFTSSVAKNPSDLSQAYSKTVTIGANTTEVYVMPNDDVLYWYGYKSSNCEDISTANGWSGSTFVAPTYNTNDVRLSSVIGDLSGLGNKNAITNNSKICVIYKGVTAGGGHYGVMASNTSKNTNGAPQFSTFTSNTTAYKEIEATNSYIFVDCESGRVSDIYAFWYE